MPLLPGPIVVRPQSTCIQSPMFRSSAGDSRLLPYDTHHHPRSLKTMRQFADTAIAEKPLRSSAGRWAPIPSASPRVLGVRGTPRALW